MFNKKMIEEWAAVIGALTQVVTAVSLAAIALVIVMMWKKGEFGLTGSAIPAPTAAVPGAQAPEPVTQLADAQWKELIDKAKNVKGKNDAKVTVVEFTDYQCPFCSRFYTDTYGQIMKNFVDTGKVRYIVANLPLPFHPNAHISAQAAECAGDQKKYWEMHDKLFVSQTEWASEGDPKPKFEGYAKQIGINTSQFNTCLASGKFKQRVDDDNALAAKVGANGTPTFYVNGKQLVGAQPYTEFESAINAALQ